jgi:hypothetical protein
MRKKVVDCQHFVRELAVQHVPAFDPKVASVAYEEQQRILEILFKNGQTWQLLENEINCQNRAWESSC